MYVVPMECAWRKDDSNHIKYSKTPKINLKSFINRAMLSLLKENKYYMYVQIFNQQCLLRIF